MPLWSGSSIGSHGRYPTCSGPWRHFQSLGIEFVSLTEQLDTSTPTGKMVFTVLGAVAELERSLIVERVKEGLRNALAKGQRLGRPPKGPGHWEGLPSFAPRGLPGAPSPRS
jgi:resolvase-like protein